MRSFLDMSGRIDELNTNRSPLTFRDASKLNDVFREGRRLFEVPAGKWKLSGHKIPSAFTDYLSLLQNSDLRTESKKTYIVFTVCRMGTSMVVTMLVISIAKTIDGDGRYDESMPCAIN